ncbi:MAG: hypothetical protein AAF797_13450 [Planctomycetota bacterium]
MLGRLLFAIVCCVFVLALLLGLRQQRLTEMHRMADLHTQMDRDRKALWDLQVRIAEVGRPEALEAALERRGIELVPITHPQQTPALTPTLAPALAPNTAPTQ